MEKDPTKPESASDSSDEDDSSVDSKGKNTDSKSEKSSDKDSTKSTDQKPSAFFAKREKDQEDSKKTEWFGSKKDESKKDEDVAEGLEKQNEQEVDPDENLSEQEVHDATVALVESREQELREELGEVEPDSEEEFEILADAAFLASLQEKAENSDEELTELTIQEAFEEAAEDISVDHIETHDAEITPENLDEIEDNNEQLTDIDNLEEPDINQDEQDPVAPATPVTPLPNSPPPPNSPTPPIPPRPPTPPGPPIPPNPQSPQNPNYGYNNPLPSPNVAPQNPNVAPTVVIERRRGRDMLVGAVLGYIIGRRGGRKRSEKKLLPKIDKLEEQVGELHDHIVRKEEEIRTLARKTVKSTKKAELAEERVEKTEKLIATDTNEAENPKSTNETVSFSTKLVEKRKERIEVKEKLQKTEKLKSNPAVEKLGELKLKRLEIFREKRLMDGTENSPKRKPVEHMTVIELLEKVDAVEVDGEFIIELFKTGRLDEKVLREVVKNYLRGGPYEQILRRELKTSPFELQSHRENIEKLRSDNKTTSDSNNYVGGSSRQQGSVDKNPANAEHSSDNQSSIQSIMQKKQAKQDSKLPLAWIVLVVAVVTIGLLLLITSS